jgi:predicted Zn-ribbon and HTH transcriptional regulator
MVKKSDQLMGDALLQGYRCRCGHEWLPRTKGERPRVCPKCKSPNWDRPKRAVNGKATAGKVAVAESSR